MGREVAAGMNRLALVAFAIAAGCTGTYYPYSSSSPQYATATTQQTQTSADGTTTTTTSSTESYTFQASVQGAQPASYQQAPVEQTPVTDDDDGDEAPLPPVRCHPRDTANMCVAYTVIVEVGDIITDMHEASCNAAAKALNRYADAHPREIDTLERLRDLEPAGRLRAWEDRHRSEAEAVMAGALDLDSRCDHNSKLDRALRRVGFSGLIGSPAL